MTTNPNPSPDSGRPLVDAVVVGAGVVGASVALELARGGRRVLVVDKAGGAGHGSTSASSALVRFNYSTLAGVLVAWESKFRWEEWAGHLGYEDPAGMVTFERTGVIHLDVPLMPRGPALSLFDQVGVPYVELDADELAKRYPGIDAGAYWPNKRVNDDAFWEETDARLGGYLTPDAGFVNDPQQAAANLAAAAAFRGVTFRYNTRVTGLENMPAGDWRVTLDRGEPVEAPVIVNAAGPWSTQLNEMAGVGGDFTVSLRPMRQEVHHAQAPAGHNPPGGHGPAITDLDLGTYMRPGPGNTWLVGGTEPECDPFEWIEDPDAANPRVTHERHEAQMLRAARRLPTLRVPTQPLGVAGVYDVTTDWTPIYDKTDAPGYYVAIGTSGNQFKNAPMVGSIMATIVDGVESGHDHDASPLQLVGDHTGQTIDLSAFSRRRPVNRANSGTVMG